MDEYDEGVQQRQEEEGTEGQEDQRQLYNEKVKYPLFCDNHITICLLCSKQKNINLPFPIDWNL